MGVRYWSSAVSEKPAKGWRPERQRRVEEEDGSVKPDHILSQI